MITFFALLVNRDVSVLRISDYPFDKKFYLPINDTLSNERKIQKINCFIDIFANLIYTEVVLKY